MKVYLKEDELFPMFYASTDGDGVEAEIPDEVWERWLKVNEEWLALQGQMQAAHEEAARKYWESARHKSSL